MVRCTICALPLEDGAGRPCLGCRTIHCPICHAPAHVFIAAPLHQCRHLIAMACPDECDGEAGGWERSPFLRWGIAVPRPAPGMEWTDTHRLLDAFGLLLPLLNAYEPDGVDTTQLFELLLEEITVPVERIAWRFAGAGVAREQESAGTDYFAADPEAVQRQVTRLVARLADGFDQMAGLDSP